MPGAGASKHSQGKKYLAILNKNATGDAPQESPLRADALREPDNWYLNLFKEPESTSSCAQGSSNKTPSTNQSAVRRLTFNATGKSLPAVDNVRSLQRNANVQKKNSSPFVALPISNNEPTSCSQTQGTDIMLSIMPPLGMNGKSFLTSVMNSSSSNEDSSSADDVSTSKTVPSATQVHVNSCVVPTGISGSADTISVGNKLDWLHSAPSGSSSAHDVLTLKTVPSATQVHVNSCVVSTDVSGSTDTISVGNKLDCLHSAPSGSSSAHDVLTLKTVPSATQVHVNSCVVSTDVSGSTDTISVGNKLDCLHSAPSGSSSAHDVLTLKTVPSATQVHVNSCVVSTDVSGSTDTISVGNKLDCLHSAPSGSSSAHDVLTLKTVPSATQVHVNSCVVSTDVSGSLDTIFVQNDTLVMPLDDDCMLPGIIPTGELVELTNVDLDIQEESNGDDAASELIETNIIEDGVAELIETNMDLGSNPEENLQEITENNPVVNNNAAPSKLSRKRSRNPSQHKAAVAKRALYAGEEHLNRSGQLRPAPTMRLPCACRMKCSVKISEEERLQIFKVYNTSLGSKDKQWAYIRAHSSANSVVKSTTNSATPKRKVSRKYFFVVKNEDEGEKTIPVCKVMFMNTLSIWDGVIDSAYAHINQETKTPTPDKRGKHSNRPNKTTEEQKETVRAHINSYPRIPSHYVRSRIQREYVESGLSIAKMHRQYKEWCNEQSFPKSKIASRSQYRFIFNYEFNIGFFKPKKDRCQLCTLMKTGTRAERERYKLKWVDHYNSKKACYAEQRKARNLLTKRNDVAMLSFDLQKVLPCPKSETSLFFYKNKLSLYNLTVYDSAPHKGLCYVWHAGIAKRGANEVGSAVRDALISCAKAGKKEVLSFSDSCSGQNKNRYIYAMMLNVSAKYSIKIRHCFLTPGHTYNDADGVHARIEAASRDKDLYDLKEWIELIKNAKEEQPMYDVKRMKRTDFFDLKEIVEKQNWKFDRQKNQVEWNKVKVVEAGYDGEGVLAFQYKIGGEKHYLDTKRKRGHPVNLKTYEPKVAYPENIPLKAKTVQHLSELCKSLAIPSKYHPFYNDILANVDPVEEEDDSMDPVVDEDSYDPDEVLNEDGNLEDQMAEEGDEGEENEEDEDDPDDD